MTMMEWYWVSPKTPSSRIVEVTLVRDCVRYSFPEGVQGWDGKEPVADDPCAWRHSWYYRVQPDGRVTLLFDEGDRDKPAR